MSLQKALALASTRITEELGRSSDQVPIGDDPIVASNLHLCYHNASCTSTPDWELFLSHVCWPEENEFPEHLFLVPASQVPGYKRLMNRIEELYNE